MAKAAWQSAARAGLKLDRAEDGQVVVADNWTPEGRRRRIWGDVWTDARVPELPTPGELAGALTRCGAPVATVDTEGRRRLALLRGAALRCAEELGCFKVA